ncbi:MAG: hypothetical protein WA996_26050 [Candidatus Promineifilaceae bacterium]
MGKKLCLGIATATAGLAILYRLGTRRGATFDEVRRTLPGDSLIPDPSVVTTHAVTIHAPAGTIWPWLMQVGYHRGGWYTDSKIDEFSFDYFFKIIAAKDKKPVRRPSADRILPQFQDLQIGDEVPDGPPGTVYYTVRMMETNRHLVFYSDTYDRVIIPGFVRGDGSDPIIDNTWAFVLAEVDSETTRFIVRTRIRVKYKLVGLFFWPFLMLGESIFPILMLNGFKRRAEQATLTSLDQDAEKPQDTD